MAMMLKMVKETLLTPSDLHKKGFDAVIYTYIQYIHAVNIHILS